MEIWAKNPNFMLFYANFDKKSNFMLFYDFMPSVTPVVCTQMQ